MKADKSNLEENKDNILFQPNSDSNMIDILESNADNTTNYDTNVDTSTLYVNKIRCCLCGVLMIPNECNTCI